MSARRYRLARGLMIAAAVLTFVSAYRWSAICLWATLATIFYPAGDER